jgi:hypothetical protein
MCRLLTDVRLSVLPDEARRQELELPRTLLEELGFHDEAVSAPEPGDKPLRVTHKERRRVSVRRSAAPERFDRSLVKLYGDRAPINAAHKLALRDSQ